jgi:uncharacterized protein (TIGR00369 family)
VVDEPVRGGFPDPSFYSLPGIDQARAWLRGWAPTAPLAHLIGIRPTQVGSGTATVTMPASPSLQSFEGHVEGMILMQDAMAFAVLTGAPPATEVRATVLIVNHLRPCSVEAETLVAKARTLHSGRTFTLAEVTMEDALGRGVAHATGTFVLRPIEPPPPPWTGSTAPLEPPRYPTPDPYLRVRADEVLSPDDDTTAFSFLRRLATGELPPLPALNLLGMHVLDVSEGTVAASLTASEWLCGRLQRVTPGAVAYLAWFVAGGAIATLMPLGHRLGVFSQNVSFLRPVTPDGQELLARGTVTHHGEEFLVARSEVSDSAGNIVATGSQTSLFIPRRRRAPSGAEPERVLATVLFTDIVGSSEAAERLGDARWRELLEAHHGLVRKQLGLFKGKEVKTTGDGFLATFDSPGRAVQCARAIREAIHRLGLEIRAGLHAGECEVSGADVAGIAVHIAARIQGSAGAGEILVSGTVRDLVTGSGLRFADHGRHHLKGIEGDWALFSLEG